jgi:peptidyl-prolyl cis-trans isomerase SurA
MSSKFEVEMLPPAASDVLTKLKITKYQIHSFYDENEKDIVVVVTLINKIDAHKANISEDYQLITTNFLRKRERRNEKWISHPAIKNLHTN